MVLKLVAKKLSRKFVFELLAKNNFSAISSLLTLVSGAAKQILRSCSGSMPYYLRSFQLSYIFGRLAYIVDV